MVAAGLPDTSKGRHAADEMVRPIRRSGQANNTIHTPSMPTIPDMVGHFYRGDGYRLRA